MLSNTIPSNHFIYTDGGRSATGRKGTAGDCAARALSIALKIPYDQAYKELANQNKAMGHKKSARDGIFKEVFDAVLNKHGFVWSSAPKFNGRKARCSDLSGRVIARQAGHFVAVVDGVPHDIWDCSHKMVYGYWSMK